jgi:Spy/CpxP family protein refolding chaperone
MRKTIVIGSFIAALVFGAVVTAQAVGKGEGKGAACVKQGKAKFDPAKFEQARLDGMKKKLDLTDGQVSKLKALFKSQQAEMKPIREKMKTNMDALRKKREAKASEADLKTALDKLAADRQSMQELRKKHQEQIRGILTPEQQAKMVLDRPGKGKAGFGDRRQHRAGKVENKTAK